MRWTPMICGASALALGVSLPAVAHAQEASPVEGTVQVELQQLRERDAASQARIAELERRLSMLEQMQSQKISDNEADKMRGKGSGSTLRGERIGDTVIAVSSPLDEVVLAPPANRAVPQTQPVAAPTSNDPAKADPEDRKAPAPVEAVEQATRNQQGYFGNRLSIEPGITYSHFDDARINLSGFLALDAIFLGRISIDQITADVMAADVTARYGIDDRLQVDANIPYLYRHSNFQSGGVGGNASGVAEKDVSGHGLGDLNMGLSHRVLRESAGLPDTVVNVRVKAPTGRHPFGVELVEVPNTEGNLAVPATLSTGSGVWGASAGVSFLKTLDPLVVFGSMTYFHNFARRFDDLAEAPGDQPGTAKVGDAFQYGAGLAFALNDRSSINMSFTQRIIERSRLQRDGQPSQVIVGSQANVGLLNLGATFALSDKMTLITNASVGMTADAPDMVLSLRVPVRF